MPAKSTGCIDKDEAHFTAMSWLNNGLIPYGDKQEFRKAEEVFSVDDILFRMRNAPLNENDTERIIQVLKNKGLIQSADISGVNQTKLIDFLYSFWDWENSPYIAEKRAYKQVIGLQYLMIR